MKEEERLLIEEIKKKFIKQNNLTHLLTETMLSDGVIKKLVIEIPKIKKQSPAKKNKFVLYYKGTANISFKVFNDKLSKTEIKQKVKNIVKKQSFVKMLKNDIYSQHLLFNNINNEKKFFDVTTKNSTITNLIYDPYSDYWRAYTTFVLKFYIVDYFVENIARAKTSKSFFFKNYKIKYMWTIPYLLRYKTDNYKQLCEKAIDFGIRKNEKLKKYIEKLINLKITNNIEFDIKIYSSNNTIKLIVVRGIIKWLKNFGISPVWAKYIVAGLSFYGVLKLLKKKDKEKYEQAQRLFKKFLGK